MIEKSNNSLGVLRGQVIVTMLRGIRSKVMTTMAVRNAQASALNQPLPPTVIKQVNKAVAAAGKMGKLHAGNMKFEILVGKNSFVVDREKNHCTCGE